MLTNQHVRVLVTLLIAVNQASCLAENFERTNHHKLATLDSKFQTHSTPRNPQYLPVRPDDRTVQYRVTNLEHPSREPSVRAANNEIDANGFLQQQSRPSSTREHQPAVASHLNLQADRQEVAQVRLYPQNLTPRSGLNTNDAALPLVHRSIVARTEPSVLADDPSASQPSSIELALRQASIDESVLQSSPSIVPYRYRSNFDWFTQAPASLKPAGQAAREPHWPSAADNTDVISVARQNFSGSGNATNLSHMNITSPAIPNTTFNFHHTKSAASQHMVATQPDYHREHERAIQSGEPQVNSSSLIEFNNQVIYEGPVTTPPPPNDEYLASTELSVSVNSINRSNNNDNNNNNDDEHANSNAWWAIGVGDEFERANNLTRANYRDYCDRSPLLNGNKQRSLCRLHPRIMSVVARGLRMAIDECQRRFAHSRWNCSLVLSSHADRDIESIQNHDLTNGDKERAPSSGQQIFGNVMRSPNRERSFLNAVSAAALAHSMTKACRQGEMPEECGCDRKIRSTNKGRTEWIGCSDDIEYGAKFSRDFTDNFDTNEPDAMKTIYLHNNEVGRRVFKTITDITCTCLNGQNGLCETKRCWKHMGSFPDVVDQIMERYESATHVQKSNKDPQKLRPVRRGVRKPKRKDLVYMDESPDYCIQDLRIGVLGTQNRMCNSTSQGPDSCSLLCCGRGFQNVIEHIEEDCNCKFVWCCQVKCEKCSRYVTNEVCN